MSDRNFFSELKRRHVYNVAVAYLVASWLLIQIATQVFPFFGIPNWIVRLIVLFLILGFPVALVLSWAFDITPGGIKRAEAIESTKSLTRRTGRRFVGVTIALAVMATGLLAFRMFRSSLMSDSAAMATRLPAPPNQTIPEKSIAVLPMVNSTADPTNEYFSDGMSEEFISSLGRLRELKVVGRTSSFQFKGKTDDSKTIGEKLGVYYLLEGSVRRAADRVRIAVALIKSGDGVTVWSEVYDRDLKDIFAVQSEIANAVAKELKVALLGNDGKSAQLATAATPSNQNIEAYDALLQGNFYYERRSVEDCRKAIGFYEEATRLDSGYALAYAKLSIAAGALASNYLSSENKERQEATAKARTAAESALRLDLNLAEAHLAKGNVFLSLDFDHIGAEREFRRAVELSPQNPAVSHNLALLLTDLGRLEEAVALDQRAIVLDPLRATPQMSLAFSLIALGRYDEAEAAVRNAIALQPQSGAAYRNLAVIQILRGKPADAVELAKQETDPVWRTIALALAYFANGDRGEADAQLKKLIDENADDAGSQVASVYALRNEPEKVFEWLEHAWNTHDSGVTEILADPFLKAYKTDPRFIAFAQKVGVIPKAALHP